MNRIENYDLLKNRIVNWLVNYVNQYSMDCFVIGVSGGIDSSVVSTLAAETGVLTYALNMPIHQKPEQVSLSSSHIEWLEKKI